MKAHYFLLLTATLLSLTYSYDRLNSLYSIKELGYNVTIHNNVTTADGYILTLFRVNKNLATFKGAVYIVHGLAGSGLCWFLNKPNKLLPLLLADDGYDVWIGNMRGAFTSLRHVRWDYNEGFGPYWNYSFHEIGIYDLSATIDFILNETKCKKLVYIGHSQGTTAFFAMASQLPEYNKKIALTIALAPVAFMRNNRSPIFRIVDIFKQVLPDFPVFGFALPALGDFFSVACSREGIGNICLYGLFLAAGFDYDGLDIERIDRLATMAEGVSLKQIYHFTQLYESGLFTQYNYSPEENLRYYGSLKAPKYNLSEVTTKVLLYYSNNDRLSEAQDVYLLHKLLPESEMVRVNRTSFNHIDYLLAKQINPLLHNSIRSRIAALKDYC